MHHARMVAGALTAAMALAAGLAAANRPPLVLTVLSDAVTQEAVQERPRVLIYHTHTWEAYEMTEETQYRPTEKWRTKDDRFNVVRVGEELHKELTARGFEVVHDKTPFEPPNLSASYKRSLEMLIRRRDAGERYDYLFDIHRDAYSGTYNGKNGIEIDGKKASFVMLLVGKGTGATGAGFDERPDWPRNLELAQAITEAMNQRAPGITRDVKIKSGRFNQHISPGALLIEVGNNRNTLEEALAACPIIADAIADVHEKRND